MLNGASNADKVDAKNKVNENQNSHDTDKIEEKPALSALPSQVPMQLTLKGQLDAQPSQMPMQLTLVDKDKDQRAGSF